MPTETLSLNQVETISIVSTFVSALSVAGSTFIILCYLAFPQLRKFAFQLVFVLSLNDFFNQIGDFLTPSNIGEGIDAADPSELCLAQAWLESFFELSSVMWTTSIAATLYMSIFLRMSVESIESKFIWMVVVCNGVPLLLTIIPGALGYYGESGAWCWITDDHDEWRYIQFFVPLFLAITFNCYVYVSVIRLINNTLTAADSAAQKMGPGSSAATEADQTAQKMRAVVFKLQFYPMILIGIWLFAVINRLYESFSGGKKIFVLFLLQKAFSSSQGMLNALVYGLSPEVRDTIRNLFAPACPVCCAAGDADERKVLSGAGQPSRVNRTRLEDELDDDSVGRGGGGRGGGAGGRSQGVGGRGGAADMYGTQEGGSDGMGFQVQRTASFAEPSDLDAVIAGEEEDEDDLGVRVTSPVMNASSAIAIAAGAGRSQGLGGERSSIGRSEVEMSDRGDSSYRSAMSGAAPVGSSAPNAKSLPGIRSERAGSHDSSRDVRVHHMMHSSSAPGN